MPARTPRPRWPSRRSRWSNRRCTASCGPGPMPCLPTTRSTSSSRRASRSRSWWSTAATADSSFYLTRGARHRQHADFQRRDGAGRHASRRRCSRGGCGRHPERRGVAASPRRRRAEALRRSGRRAAGCRRRADHVAARTTPTCCRDSSARWSIAWTAAAAPSASATTATRCSRCSRRRAAATSPLHGSCATGRVADRLPRRASSRATTMAALLRRSAASAPAASSSSTTTLDDSWNDLALKPVYLPLVHQLVRYICAVRADQSRGPPSVRSSTSSTLLKSKTDRVDRHPVRRAAHRRRRTSRRFSSWPSTALTRCGHAANAVGARRPDRGQHRPGRVGPDADRHRRNSSRQ